MTTATQPTLALDPIVVHCFIVTCVHTVTAYDPGEAHDRMEEHYRTAHAAYIDSVVESLS